MSKKSSPVKLPKHKRVRKGRDALALVRLDIAHAAAHMGDIDEKLKLIEHKLNVQYDVLNVMLHEVALLGAPGRIEVVK